MMTTNIRGSILHASADEDNAWQDAFEYIASDTVWHKTDDLVFDKPIYIDNNATLTIEAGAVVYLNGGDADLSWGNIIAIGTQDEPITITSDTGKIFTVMFEDATAPDQGGKESRLEYVHIVGGGTYQDPDECGTMARKKLFFIETAFAGDCPWGTPALQYNSGRVSIDHTDFIGNHYADISINATFNEDNMTDFLSVAHSNFGTNTQSKAVVSQAYCFEELSAEECRQRVVMKDNWWGDMSGPYFETSAFELPNTDGTGDKIEGEGVLVFTPFALEAFDNGVSCFKNCVSNVIFLPGVEASRLYAYDDPNCALINCENQLWEPNRNEDVKKLYLDANGKSTDAYPIYTRDIISEATGGKNIYQSFIDTMDDLKDTKHLINDWAPVPYDWRLSLEDILQSGAKDSEGNIVYGDTTSAPYIITELKRLAVSSKTGKVTIVTHSNGGLVAKALMQKIGDAETKKLIDEVVMVGAPQVGTPIAIGAMLHGYQQDLMSGLILSRSTARGLAEYMPSAYTLLPFDTYFDTVETPVITIDADKLPEWSAKYGDTINSQSEMNHFLTDDYKRVPATDTDVQSPTTLHTSLLDDAVTRQNTLDDWVAPAGVKVVQIAGWGVPMTVSGMHYTTKTKVLCEKDLCSAPHEQFTAEPVFTVDGDGTVVTPSALWMGNVERYWVDLDSYNIFLARHVDHSTIFEVSDLDTFIADLITHTAKPLSDYSYLSTEVPPTDNKDRLQYSLHSPLSLDLYDEQGRHTGLDKDGNIEEQIPGTYYRQFGEVKYIFSDTGAHYRIVMNGYAKGTFTLEVESLKGDVSTGKIVFKDMPTTDKTKATLSIDGGINSVQDLAIDEDGDGVTDHTVHPKLGKEVTLDGDTTPTTTLYSVSYDNTVAPTVQEDSTITTEKKQTKHNEKQHKKNKKSKHEQKQAEAKKKLAVQKVIQIVPKQKIVPEAIELETPKDIPDTVENNDASSTPVVEGDFINNENMVQSQYQEIPQNEISMFERIKDTLMQGISKQWHRLWFSFRLLF
jgi:pimeloyl-ACP methyl ester carboxylesterase